MTGTIFNYIYLIIYNDNLHIIQYVSIFLRKLKSKSFENLHSLHYCSGPLTNTNKANHTFSWRHRENIIVQNDQFHNLVRFFLTSFLDYTF